MAFVLRGFGRIPSIRTTCVSSRGSRALSGKRHASGGSSIQNEEDKKSSVKKPDDEKRKAAKARLNDLLESIQKEPVAPARAAGVSDRLARPGGRPRPREVVPGPARPAPQSPLPPSRQLTLDEQVAEAAREVASSLSGDPAQTEMELLQKLSGDMADRDQKTERIQLSELMSGMKVDRAAAGRAQLVRQQVGERRADAVRQTRRERPGRASSAALPPVENVELNRGPGLNIFTQMKTTDDAEVVPAVPSQWERIHERELRLSVLHPPANAWEEMIVWTEQGKLWHLPVNNEQGLESEASVGFHEHVFLERHLEPWCPPRGPVRQFMDVVCVALGQNPWLSVEEKKEHIEWFRQYFAGKQKLLQELKAV